MKSQILKTKCNTTERVFVILLTISLGILTFKTLYYSPLNIYTVLIYLILVTLFLTLTFLAYYDFKKMEVHTTVSFVLMLVLLLINVTLFFLFKDNLNINILNNWNYNPYNNILSTLTLGSIFQLVVLISKEKALGQGDVRIAIITGLLIGFNNLIYWLYITIFTALIYGFILAYKKKKFKNLKIPFVPFMVLGIIVLILLYI